MRDAKTAAVATGLNLFNAVTLISTYTLGRKYLAAGTAMTLVGNALAFRQLGAKYKDAIVCSLAKTCMGFLDLGVLLYAREGLRCFRGGFRFAGGSLMTISGTWTAWRIGVDSLDIGELEIDEDTKEVPFGFVGLSIARLVNRISDR